jgi:mannose-6-phosphate isomerase-like protein (cupin superfamily)
MPEYSVENLKRIEDSAVKFGHAPDVEARFARAPLGFERSGLSYQRLAPNARQPGGHRHREQEEVYVVIGGSGRVKLEDEIVELERLDAVRVAPAVARCFEGGPDGIEFIAFGAGGAGDVEMLPDWWKDQPAA